MTAAHDIDWPTVLAEIDSHHPPRRPAGTALDVHPHPDWAPKPTPCTGAGYGERSTERTNSRNGYLNRQFDTRTGSLDLAALKLRQGHYFPDWLMKSPKRAERALTTVVAACYLLGVSTRRTDKLVETLGITSLSKSQVSVMAKELDTAVEAFRYQPARRRPVHFPRRGRAGPQGPRTGSGGQPARADRRRVNAWQRCRTHYRTNLMAVTP